MFDEKCKENVPASNFGKNHKWM